MFRGESGTFYDYLVLEVCMKLAFNGIGWGILPYPGALSARVQPPYE